MAVFSVNQATQMYVGAATTQLLGGVDTYYVINGEKTDVIKAGHVLRETTKTVGDMNVKAPVATLTVATSVKSNEYLVRLTITDDAGVSNAYIKSVAAIAADATPANLATALRTALDKAAARDIEPLYTVGGTGTSITITPNLIHTTGKRFIVPQINVEVVNLTDDEDTLTIADPAKGWVKYAQTSVAGSGLAKLKDLEYFCAGEKGDVYRGAAYPNDFPFESKLGSVSDSTPVTTIHYYDDCSNEGVQRSEKTIIIVGKITAPAEAEDDTPIYDVK